MEEKLIVCTQVNEVIGGAIRDVTLTVKERDCDVLSARMEINESCTEAKLIKAETFTKDESRIASAIHSIGREIHERGIETMDLTTTKVIRS